MFWKAFPLESIAKHSAMLKGAAIASVAQSKNQLREPCVDVWFTCALKPFGFRFDQTPEGVLVQILPLRKNAVTVLTIKP